MWCSLSRFSSRSFVWGFTALALVHISANCVSAAGWQHDFDSAEAESKRTGKPLLVHFYADWCGPCRQMERLTLNSHELLPMLDQAVLGVKINADHRPDLVRRFGVSSLPTDVLVDAGGKVVTRASGFQSARQYVAKITGPARQAALAYAKPQEPVVRPEVHVAESQPSPSGSETVNSVPPPVMVVSTRPPLLRGYSPVALHESREWVKGKPEYTVEYRGQYYRLATADEKARFEENPRRYTPRLLGCDAVVFNKEDRAVVGKLDFAAFYGEELYLFESDANRRLFKKSPDLFITTRVVKVEDIETAIR